MTDEPPNVDYKAKYEEILAERDAYSTKLGEYVAENNTLKAQLKVQQEINRKTIGASGEPPKTETPGKSLTEAFEEYKKNYKEEKK